MARQFTTGYSIRPVQECWAGWTCRISGGPSPMVSLPKSARPIRTLSFAVSSGPRSRPRCWELIPGRHTCCWWTATRTVGSSWLAMPRISIHPGEAMALTRASAMRSTSVGSWRRCSMAGGAGLLASYEVERRPVAERTIQEAVANMSVLAPELGNPELAAPGLVGEQARRAAASVIQAAKDREFHSLGLVLGYSTMPHR